MSSPLKYDPDVAIAQLSAVDAKLSRLIERVGPFAMPTRETMSPFQMLLHSIVYQQITGKAAASIHARLVALFPGSRPGPRRMQKLSDEALRAAGMSRPKVRAARELADKALDGTVPTLRELERMNDDAIIARLTQVRGIGQWSAEMMLIFQLGRPDVLPVTDLGVRKGFQLSHGGRELPEPKKLLRYGERWRPYRSVASWYLWRANYLP
ncbi:MAG: DNA-3-methyladenine glycosylase 2 family protein [Lysobacterales bacterium]|nr:MAG: DNA-3-methyladenine glycosylase 2 family protein [Xanthomonadales bacterium]